MQDRFYTGFKFLIRIFLCKSMDSYCNVCDKISKIESKSEHLQSLSQNDIDECIKINHTIKNPDFQFQGILPIIFTYLRFSSKPDGVDLPSF